MRHAKSWRTVEVDYNTNKEKKCRQLGPLLNAHVIAEWVKKSTACKSIGIVNTFTGSTFFYSFSNHMCI